jgi:hypothetical protein
LYVGHKADVVGVAEQYDGVVVESASVVVIVLSREGVLDMLVTTPVFDLEEVDTVVLMPGGLFVVRVVVEPGALAGELLVGTKEAEDDDELRTGLIGC